MSSEQKSDQFDAKTNEEVGAPSVRQSAESGEREHLARELSSHGKLIAVVAFATVAVIVLLLSAFAWPGWALNGSGGKADAVAPGVQTPTTPSIKAKDLPAGSTRLLKSMPDSVLNFARVGAAPSDSWKDASPLEEYSVVYSTGGKSEDVTVVMAQWPNSDGAKAQYASLAKGLKGANLAQGDVKVSGNVTGSYVVRADGDAAESGSSGSRSGSGKAGKAGKAKGTPGDGASTLATTALWRNDSVLFQATGTKACVQRFYQKFPL